MRHFHLATLLLAATAGAAAAQVIPIRTVPILQADRFEIFPSRDFGMAGVSIALADTLGDPSTNPATAARLAGTRVFGSPIHYSVSKDAGRGGALPFGGFARSGEWFAGGALALQAVEPVRPPTALFRGPGPQDGIEQAAPRRGSAYGFAVLGRSWPGSGLSVAGSMLAAWRTAVDGIGLLYGESERVESSGSEAAFRLGLLKEWRDGRSLEAVAVHSRTRMTHDVTYADLFWDPGSQAPAHELREERNADRADVWGLHVVHARPLTPGWRIGWLATGNRVVYPSVPRYDTPKDGVMDIPSGRGQAFAWNLGVGLATHDGPTRFGIDLVYEPIWSRVWSEAAAPTATSGGGTIPAGGTMIENRVRFSNALVRVGAGREWPLEPAGHAIDVRFGVATRMVDYRLAQFDHRQGAGRNHDERWVEWTPTWGTGLRLGDVEIRYHGSLAEGTRRPGAAPPTFRVCDGICLLSASMIGPGPAPADLLELGPVSVITQQIFVSLAVGRARQAGGDR